MKNTWIFILVIAIIICFLGFVSISEKNETVIEPNTSGTISNNTGSASTSVPTEQWICQADARICPDGSAVGRTGPTCEFVSCPAQNATSTKLTTYVGGTVTGINLTINPREVVSDNRCPQSVQCITAGTVKVRTAISTQVAHGELIFDLNVPQVFGDFVITLIEVTPAQTAGKATPISLYRLTFEVKKQ